MKKVILQPIGNDYTKEDFISFNWCTWAVKEKYKKPAMEKECKKTWEDSVGDTVVFVSKGVIFGIAIVESIEYDYECYKDYPLRYYWSDIKFVNIAMSDFNEVVGYSPKAAARFYRVVKDDNIEEVFNLLNQAKPHIYKPKEYQRTVREKFLLNIFWANGEILLMSGPVPGISEDSVKVMKEELEEGEEIVEYYQVDTETGGKLVYVLMDNKHNLPYATRIKKYDYIEIFLVSKKEKALKRMERLINEKIKIDMKRFVLTREEYSEDKPYEEYVEESRIVIENDIRNRYYLAIFAPNPDKTSIKYEDVKIKDIKENK